MIKINGPHLTTAGQHVHSGMLSATLLGEPLLAAAQRTLQNTKSTPHTNPNTWAHTILDCTDSAPNTTKSASLTATTVFRKLAFQHEARGPTCWFEPPVQ